MYKTNTQEVANKLLPAFQTPTGTNMSNKCVIKIGKLKEAAEKQKKTHDT